MSDLDTSATLTLDALGISYQRRIYEYDPSAGKLGVAAAAALGLAPDHVLKTLMVQIDGRPACVVLPADRELDFVRVATAFGGRKAKMLSRPDAEQRTGYKIGGVSPFGQRSAVPTAFEQSGMDGPPVVINGGDRGLLLELAPQDALLATNGMIADLVRPIGS
ncbi:YbaK/EbsC family protein [Gluconobacter frateurii]|uniref:Cys-tRNA(Pro)/Cys-tRNA(Cys) deacylase n=1 Tax=Gluconobacter frateurii NRIC 0228 TaxID=1307946 RepID=A0ABQ0QC41_9PROT|nr:YbaK/EbsC family protein [Gluconobacter frateurii]GBR12498.1 transcriptional regulator [Gluconobacter frateurii NRIC 0228]GLP89465.1 Cys-tRNA(Pro)/Cys-tRNA(Cys) deacylase [Gluconobacter frateurii]